MKQFNGGEIRLDQGAADIALAESILLDLAALRAV